MYKMRGWLWHAATTAAATSAASTASSAATTASPAAASARLLIRTTITAPITTAAVDCVLQSATLRVGLWIVDLKPHLLEQGSHYRATA